MLITMYQWTIGLKIVEVMLLAKGVKYETAVKKKKNDSVSLLTPSMFSKLAFFFFFLLARTIHDPRLRL